MPQKRVNIKYSVKELPAEIATWKKLITSRMEENILLKNMLSDILRNNYDQSCLEEIEEFQTKFISQDEITNELRRKVSDLDNLLFDKTPGDEMMKNLQDDIVLSESRFYTLVSSFKDFQQKMDRKNAN